MPGIDSEVKPHPAKALSPIVSNPDGKLTDDNLEQFEKQATGTAVIVLGSVAVLSSLQVLKTPVPILVTLSGITMEVRPELENALLSIVVTVEGIVTDVSDVQL